MKKKRAKKTKLSVKTMKVRPLQTDHLLAAQGGYLVEGGGGGYTDYCAAYTDTCPQQPCKTTLPCGTTTNGGY